MYMYTAQLSHINGSLQPKTLEKYKLSVRGFNVKNELLMGSH